MATLYDLAMQYLNQSLPKTFKYDRTPRIGIPTPVPGPIVPEPVKKILPVQSSGADGFSVYNPDPNRTRNESNYNERPYKSTVYNNAFPMMGDPMANQATGALNADGLMSYPGDKPPTGLEKLIGMLPGQQVLKGITNMLPVNRTGILQNELLGAGFQLNDIGQIVGDPRTVEGVMAGLNSSRMDAGSFDKKSANIENTLSEKYGLSQTEIDSIKAGNITEGIKSKAYNKTMGTTSNLVQDLLNTEIAKGKFKEVIDKTTTVFDAKSLKKDPSYVPFDTQLDINNMINKEKEDEENFDPLDPTNTFKNKNAFEINNIVDLQRTKDAIEEDRLRDLDAMDPNPGIITDTSNKGFNPNVTPGESGFIGLDKEFDIDPRDIDGPGTYDGPGIVDNRTPEEQAYGSCFIAGTKISMADGTLKNIEDIIVGDKVKGHKEENTVIKLDPTLLANRKLYSFNDNEHYFFTSEHPFMTEEGWKSIKPEKTKERDGVELYNQLKGELKIGDKLVTENGLIEIKNIKSKEMNNPEMPLYNFNVSNDNSYIADKYIVHNKGNKGSADPKIVCTMMNQSYGFGSFRNKIWKKFHKDLSPEYQKGYHKLFLPLVRIAKTNKVVKKILEHIAVHSTIDMRQATRGKMHLLGRIYRKILLPLCYFVGKHG